MTKTPVILVSNFLSASRGSRGVCEELADRLESAGTPVLRTSDQPLRLLRLCDMLHTIWKERRRYAVAQVDVYSGPAFFWAEAACALLQSLGKPIVLTLHGGNLPAFAKAHPKRARRLLAEARVVTTPSEYLFEQMGPYRRGLRLLPNALELNRYPYRLREKAAPLLVWLRAFHQIYNPSLALKVLGLLAPSCPEARLTMIGPDKGDGSLQRFQQLAATLGLARHVSLTGGVAKSRVPAALDCGDIFLNTTQVDNAPVSVLEAMACGLCVVSTNVGGLPYLLRDGQDALLVQPDDAEAMTAAVNRLLFDPALARRLSENGRARLAQHDWSVVLPQWERLFAEVAGKNEARVLSESIS